MPDEGATFRRKSGLTACCTRRVGRASRLVIATRPRRKETLFLGRADVISNAHAGAGAGATITMAVDQVTEYTYSMDASAAETLLAIRYTAASTRAPSRKREIKQICPPSSVPSEYGMRKSKRRRRT